MQSWVYMANSCLVIFIFRFGHWKFGDNLLDYSNKNFRKTKFQIEIHSSGQILLEPQKSWKQPTLQSKQWLKSKPFFFENFVAIFNMEHPVTFFSLHCSPNEFLNLMKELWGELIHEWILNAYLRKMTKKPRKNHKRIWN